MSGKTNNDFHFTVRLKPDIDNEIIRILRHSKSKSAVIRKALRETYLEIGGIASWIRVRVDDNHYHYVCEHCSHSQKYRKTPYCPICGYLMVNSEMKEKE